MKVWKKDTGKCIENRNNEVVDKVSDGVNISDDYNGEIMLNKNNKDVVENGVSKRDTVNNSTRWGNNKC